MTADVSLSDQLRAGAQGGGDTTAAPSGSLSDALKAGAAGNAPPASMAPPDTQPTWGSVGASFLKSGLPEGVKNAALMVPRMVAQQPILAIPNEAESWLANKAGIPMPTNEQMLDKASAAGSYLLGKVGLGEQANPARNAPERVAQAAGEAIPAFMAFPEGGAEAAAEEAAPAVASAGKGIINDILQKIGGGASAKDVLASAANKAAMGAVAGTAGQSAAEAVPDKYKPVANMAGQVLAGGLYGAGTAAVGAAGDAAGNILNSAKENLTKPGAATAGTRDFLNEASNPQNLKDNLNQFNNPDFNPEIVPGSKPTTFEMTGDQGVGRMQRGFDTQNSGAAIDRRAQQNAAQVQAMHGLDTQGADSGNVSDFFSGQLKAIDAQSQAKAAALQADLAAKAQTSGMSVEQQGNQLSAGLKGIYDQKEEQEDAIWKTVDQDGNVFVDSGNLKDHAAELQAKTEPELLDPKENAIYSILGRQPQNIPFDTLKNLKTEMDSAVNSRNIENAPRARLIQLRNTLFDTIDHAATYVANSHLNDIAEGTRTPEDSLFGRLQAAKEDFNGIQGVSTGPAAGVGNAGYATGPEGNVPSVSGKTIPGSGGLSGNEGNTGLQSPETEWQNANALIYGEPKTQTAAPVISKTALARAAQNERLANKLEGQAANTADETQADQLRSQAADARSKAQYLRTNPSNNKGNVGNLQMMPQTLRGFIIEKGGIRDDEGVLKASGYGENGKANKLKGVINNKTGMSPDDMLQAVKQEGFMPSDDPNAPPIHTTDDLYRALDTEAGGVNLHRASDMGQASSYYEKQRSLANQNQENHILGGIIDQANELKMPVNRDQASAIYHLTENGMDFEDALDHILERSAIMGEGQHAAEIGKRPLFSNDEIPFAGYGEGNAKQTSGEGISPGTKTGVNQAPEILGGRPKNNAGTTGGNASTPQKPDNGTSPQGNEGESLQRIENSAVSGPYQEARAYSKQINETYRNGVIGDILQRGQYGKEYDAARSTVPSEVFNSGKTQAEDAREFFKAAEGDPKAVDAYKDFAFSSMIRNATNPQTGELSAAKLKTWMAKHGDALAEADKQSPGFSDQFKNVDSANDALNDHLLQAKQQREAIEDSAVGKFLKGEKPAVAAARILKKPDQFSQLVSAAATDSSGAATAGLRRAVLDDLTGKAQSRTESGTSGINTLKKDAFQKWVDENGDTLQKSGLFSSDEIGTLKNIAADLKRTNRSISGSKLPGGSNTAQDTGATASASGKSSIFDEAMREGAAGVGGFMAAGPMGGVAAWIGTKLLGRMRQNAMDTRMDVIRQMVEDPKFAHMMLQRLPADRPVPLGFQNRVVKQMDTLAKGVAINTAANVLPPTKGGTPVVGTAQAVPTQTGLNLPPTAIPTLQSIQSRMDQEFAPGQPQAPLMNAIKKAESGGNPNAKNPNSSAVGPYQFTTGTWKDLVDKHGDETGLGMMDRYDPAAQEKMMPYLLADNANALQSGLGRAPTPGEMYMAHVLGPTGALHLISSVQANPNRPANEVFPNPVIKANRSLFMDGMRPRSTEELYKILSSRVANA